MRFARAKGLAPSRIVGVHVLKNILIPVVTVIGLELGSMIAFAVVTETVFAWPGMGKLLIDSIIALDRPVIVAYLMRDRADVRGHQPRGRRDLYAARSARAPRRSARHDAWIAAAVDRRHGTLAETPARRRSAAAWREFAESRIAVGGARSSSCVLIVLALLAPLDRAAEPLRPAQLSIMDNKLPPGARGLDGTALPARHRRPGPRHALGDPLRPAPEPVRRRHRHR